MDASSYFSSEWNVPCRPGYGFGATLCHSEVNFWCNPVFATFSISISNRSLLMPRKQLRGRLYWWTLNVRQSYTRMWRLQYFHRFKWMSDRRFSLASSLQTFLFDKIHGAFWLSHSSLRGVICPVNKNPDTWDNFITTEFTVNPCLNAPHVEVLGKIGCWEEYKTGYSPGLPAATISSLLKSFIVCLQFRFELISPWLGVHFTETYLRRTQSSVRLQNM